MTAMTARPGAVVRLRDDTYGVILERHMSKDIVAVDLWHAGSAFVPSEEVMEVVVPDPEETTRPLAGTA
jgi:hypothetical protein